MKTHNDSITPLSLDRARAIVGYAENEFASGRHIEDAFTPFAGGGAATRFEAVQALYIVIADTYRLVSVRRARSPDEMNHFDKYASFTGELSWRILCDNIRDPAKVPDVLGDQETVQSFVGYLKTLNPASADFWPDVYKRIGLDYPTERDWKPEKDAAASGKRAWWRFW
jgi:hypothetical protein